MASDLSVKGRWWASVRELRVVAHLTHLPQVFKCSNKLCGKHFEPLSYENPYDLTTSHHWGKTLEPTGIHGQWHRNMCAKPENYIQFYIALMYKTASHFLASMSASLKVPCFCALHTSEQYPYIS